MWADKRHRLPFRAATWVFVACLRARGQHAPSNAAQAWQPPPGLAAAQQAAAASDRAKLDPKHQYTLPELVDLAEQHNPATSAAWQAAKARAGQLTIAHSDLLPTLTAAAMAGTVRQGVLFNSTFVRQTLGYYEPVLRVSYLVLDFGERAAAVRLAQYNFNNCRVSAPFDGLVTDLTTSQGAYVHTGSQVFTLIDDRAWWVIANFRETQLKHVLVGSPVDIFLMSHENVPLHGTVESIGYGVTPDPSVAGAITPGLPTVQRSLSWVHLAARYPVRVRIKNPPPGLLRIGQTAVAVVHELPAARR